MTQLTVLAAGTSQAKSDDIVVLAGDIITIGIFVADGQIPSPIQLKISIDTPGKDTVIGNLSANQPVVLVQGPGTFKISRSDISEFGVDVGAFIENS